MSKRVRQYEITEAVQGSFVGASGRIHYDLQPGIVAESEIDPEVLDVLLASGVAVKAAKPAESEESA